ncbi:MAG: hypothetical protein OXH95_04250 [bacterium]|nr:hypothetical protein [bacterium]MDE0643341.1 hypothetical protein [bacterium]MYD05193.1 hypothetical protein [Acidimicrobiia bacterium]MYF26494.1 hypothetical protein [Acidimicrobiia bacterium]
MRIIISMDERIYEPTRQIALGESGQTLDEVINELPLEKRHLGQLQGTIGVSDDFDWLGPVPQTRSALSSSKASEILTGRVKGDYS